MTNLGATRTYQACPKKEKAREETIMKVYQKYFFDSLPIDKQYWTMCSVHTHDDGTFSYGSELGQLLRNNFVNPEQFYGVDIVETIIMKNRAVLRDANWLHGDFLDMMKDAHKNNNFNPAIINADFVSMNAKSSKITSGIIELLSDPKVDVRNVMVVANVMYTNPYSGRVVALEDVDVDKLLEPYGKYSEFCVAWLRGGWDIHPMVYSYEGTGEKSNTIMSTVIFYRT